MTETKKTAKKKAATKKKAAVAKKKEYPKVVEKKFKNQLECKFSPGVLATMSDDLARMITEKDQMGSRHADIKSGLTADMKKIEADIQALASRVKSKAEHRDVSCLRIYDYNKGTVTYKRTDTGEVFRKRDIRDEEKQMDFLDDLNKK